MCVSLEAEIFFMKLLRCNLWTVFKSFFFFSRSREHSKTSPFSSFFLKHRNVAHRNDLIPDVRKSFTFCEQKTSRRLCYVNNWAAEKSFNEVFKFRNAGNALEVFQFQFRTGAEWECFRNETESEAITKIWNDLNFETMI